MKNKKGFTLIELLVVVLIIGILASIALPQYTTAVEKSRVSEAMIMLKAIKNSVDRYYLSARVYPASFNDIDITVSSNCTTSATYTECKTDNFMYQIADGAYIFAVSIKNAGFKLEINLATNTFMCGAIATNVRQNTLCKSINGATLHSYNAGINKNFYLISQG